jgi:YD repeat-containing protein
MMSGLIPIVFIISVLLLLPVPSNGQSIEVTAFAERRAGEPLDPDGLVRLNRFTGQVTIVVPILRIESRGDVGFTINQTILPGGEAPSVMPGPGTLIGVRVVTHREGSGSTPMGAIETSLRLFLLRNDGDVTEFHDDVYSGLSQARLCDGIPRNRGRLFTASDGSGMTFQSDGDVLDGTCDSRESEMFFPDGTIRDKVGRRIVIRNGEPVLIQDRNGNQLKIDGTRITDSIGRTYHVAKDALSYRGFAGVTQAVGIERAELSSLLVTDDTGDIGIAHESAVPESHPTNRPLIARITFPEGESLGFRYNRFGEVVRISHSTGWEIRLNHGSETTNILDGGLVGYEHRTSSVSGSEPIKRIAFERDENESQTKISETIYLGSDGFFGRTVTVYKGSSNIESRARRMNPHHLRPFGVGFPERTEVFATARSTPDTISISTWRNLERPIACPGCEGIGFGEVLGERMRLHPTTGETDRETYQYDANGNLTDIVTFDVHSGSSTGRVLRRRHCTFVSDQQYTAIDGPHLRSLPESCWSSPDGTEDSKEELVRFMYDEVEQNELLHRSQTYGHDSTRYGTRYRTRGNLTRKIRFRNPRSEDGMEFSRTQFDILGNPIRIYDARGFRSTLSFVDRFGTKSGAEVESTTPSELDGRFAFAFPSIDSNNIGMRRHMTWDFHVGTVLREIDWNGQIKFPADSSIGLYRFGRNGEDFRTHADADGIFQFSHSSQAGDVFSDHAGARFLVIRSDSPSMILESSGSRIVGSIGSDLHFSGRIDALGKVTSISTRWPDESAEGSRSAEQNFEYDARGNLLREVSGSIERSFEYDGNSRLVSRTDPESGTTRFEYDENDNPTVIEAGGMRLINRFDPLNRIVSRWSMTEGAPMGLLAEFEYDKSLNGRGRLTRAESFPARGPRFAESIDAYDASGNILGTTYSVDGHPIGTIGFRRDADGNLLSVTYPSGAKLNFNRTEQGASSAVEWIPSRDGTARVIAIDVSESSDGLRYRSGTGNVFSIGRTSSDQRNLTRVQGRRGDGLLFESSMRVLGLTVGGRMERFGSLKITERWRISEDIKNQQGLDVGFDPVGRMRSRRKSDGFGSLRRRWSYDLQGNRRAEIIGTDDIPTRCHDGADSVFCVPEIKRFFPTYLSNNRFVSDQNSDGSKDYIYDAGGRLLADSIGRRFAYDPMGRLERVDLPGPTSVQSIKVLRNAVGRVVGISDITSGVTTFFLRDVNGNLMAEMKNRPTGGLDSGILDAITAQDGSLRAILRQDGRLHRADHASTTSVCIEVLPGCESSSAWINTSDLLVISDDHTIDWVTARFTTPKIDPSVPPAVSIIPRNLYQTEMNVHRWILDGVMERGKSALDYFFSHPRRYNGVSPSDIRTKKSESRK